MIIRAVRFAVQSIWAAAAPESFTRHIGVNLGKGCYLFGITKDTFGSEPYLITIGNNCVIAHGADFINHDGAIHLFRKEFPAIDVFEPIVIGNDVFVGAHAVFLPGTVVEDGCIIGTGSVLRGKFAPHTVITGNPARPVGTVQGYWERMKEKTLPTFYLSREEKRTYLLKHFEGRLGIGLQEPVPPNTRG